jgi:hypothetical protein
MKTSPRLKPETKPSMSKPSVSKWKTKWPRSSDLRLWFRCMIEKCDAFDDPAEGASQAHLPIEALVQMGHADEALTFVNKFLRKQPNDSPLEIVRLSELGAQICLDRGDLVEMEKYLDRAASAPVHRKCDLGWPEHAVREFRAHNGILDPADACNDEQRIEATFKRARRGFQQAINQKRRSNAVAALDEMQQAVKLAEKKKRSCWFYHQELLKALVEVGDVAAAKRLLKRLGREAADELVDLPMLWSIGFHAEAITRATAEIRKRLKELEAINDPNIHFPVHGICSTLEFLMDHGKEKEAKTWLKKVLSKVETWPVYEVGWTTAAVYTMLAEIVVRINGAAAAETLLANASRDAAAERRPEWRKGATSAVMKAEAALRNVDELIAKARKLRSPTERRLQLSKLLARVQRWKDLAEVCSEAASPVEAARLCWAIKFELPGGAPK